MTGEIKIQYCRATRHSGTIVLDVAEDGAVTGEVDTGHRALFVHTPRCAVFGDPATGQEDAHGAQDGHRLRSP